MNELKRNGGQISNRQGAKNAKNAKIQIKIRIFFNPDLGVLGALAVN